MKKSVLYFCGGFVLGGAVASLVTYLITKRIEEKKFWDDVDCECEKDEIGDGINASYILTEEDGDTVEKKKYVTPPEIREKLLKNWDKPPLHVTEEEMAENMHPLDSDEDFGEDPSDFEDEDDRIEGVEKDGPVDIAYEADKYHKEHVNDPPKIISYEESSEIPPHFDVQEWIFWVEDGVMTDEDEQVVDDYERFVGDTLDKSEFRNNDEEETYVVSYEFDTLYHIVKYFQSYSGKMAEENEYITSEHDEDERK